MSACSLCVALATSAGLMAIVAIAVAVMMMPPRVPVSPAWVSSELERAAAACTDEVTTRHLRAIISALSR